MNISRRHLALVGVNYAPETTGIAPYTTAFAEQLARAGMSVTAATAVPHYPEWRIPSDYVDTPTRTECINGVTVERVTPRMPVPMTAVNRARFELSFAWRIRPVLNRLLPDAFIAIVPSLLSAVTAERAARRRGVPFGVIFQDLMGRSAEQSGMAGKGIGALTSAVETRLAKSAALVGVVASGFSDFLTTAGVRPEKIRHLPNWCHIAPSSAVRTDVRARLGWPDNRLVVLHAGNMGAKQALENVVDTARLAEPTHPEVLFVLMGDGSRRIALQERATGLRNLAFLEPQPSADFPDVLAAADVLIVNERATVRDMSLPSKLTSYFSAGRPVIAAVRDDGTTAAEVQRAGGGLIVPPENGQALLDAIVELGRTPERAASLGRAGRLYAQDVLGEKAAAARSVQFATDLLNSRL